LLLPELGGTGYELNLFLQDYIGKTGNTLYFDFGLIIYVIKLKLSERILFENTKEIKTDWSKATSPDTGALII
jgi:S-DNA-T family DNA segregation ATPase FtsK/SpoIIIE